MKILYIDDERGNLVLFDILFKEHFSVKTEISAETALEILDTEEFDVIVSDMKMPLMSGVELIRNAKRKKPNLQCYILTGFNYNEEIEVAISDGVVNACFSKPVNVDEVKSAILNFQN